jgi:hypothetical protein
LADGSRWWLEDRIEQDVLRTHPGTRILGGGDGHYLDVEGTRGMVRAVQAEGLVRDLLGATETKRG